MTKKELYLKRQKAIKIIDTVTPFIFWLLLLTALYLIISGIISSFHNINEITTLLNTKAFTGEELLANYNSLIAKYGEWVIGNGAKGFTITFINISKAVFNSKMIVFTVFGLILLLNAYLWGKWLLPYISKNLKESNQDMTNLTILDMEQKLNEKKD